jgi:4-hydroxy-tetrahydrodipicolinate synthase
MGEIRGLYTAMVTPFRADGSVNDEAGVALARHLLENGSHGLVICGTTGEASTMTDEEHVGFVRTIASELGGEHPIFAGAGSNDTRHAAHLTAAVVEAGAQAVLSVTPYYNKPNARGLIAHFSEVARAASGRPVILYNIPSRTALNMPPDLLAELAQIDGIEAVKQSNSAELGPIDGMTVMTGNDEDLARALDLGLAGGICVSSHVVGTEMRRMFDEPERRAEIDGSLRDLFKAMFCTASPIPVKTALNLLGHDVGGLRLPLVEADESELAIVRGALERQGLLTGAHAA